MGTWVGTKQLAVIPAITTGAGTAPVDFRQRVIDRIFYDPDPATGIDRSLRQFIFTVSYGRALLSGHVFDPVTIPWNMHGTPPVANPGGTMNDAIAAVGPQINPFPYIMVVFPNGIGAQSYAFWGITPSKSYVMLDNPIGAWGMELLHMATEFPDLYLPPAGRAPSPGKYDEMDAAAGTHCSTFTKLRMGWLDAASVATVTPPGIATLTLHPLARFQPPPPGRVAAVRLPIGGSATRYLLVEAREKLDVYEAATVGLSSGIPGEGVVVYDVDELVWPSLWLKTATGLRVGDVYSDPTVPISIRVDSHLNGGGFAVHFESHEQATPLRWSGYDKLGSNAIKGPPVAVSWGPNRIDVFVQGTDDALWTKSWDGSQWSGYDKLGSNAIKGPPVAVSWGPNRIDVFVQGTDDALWTKSWDGSQWSGYDKLGSNAIKGPPVAVSWGPNRIDVFVQGTDDALWTKSWDGSQWSGYDKLGSNAIKGPPVAVSWGPNRIDVFVQGTDDALWTKSWDGSQWSGYDKLGSNAIKGPPVAVSWGPNRIDVFVQGTDDALWTKSWDGSQWSGYDKLGSNAIKGPPVAVSWGPNRIDVFVQGTDDALWTKSWDGSQWSGYDKLGSNAIKGPPVAVSWGPNRIDVFVQGTDDALWTKSWDGN